jgi:hypothetical protein
MRKNRLFWLEYWGGGAYMLVVRVFGGLCVEARPRLVAAARRAGRVRSDGFGATK